MHIPSFSPGWKFSRCKQARLWRATQRHAMAFLRSIYLQRSYGGVTAGDIRDAWPQFFCLMKLRAHETYFPKKK
jgi:hypothetical protein